MMTVKHVEPNGAEHLYEVESVDRTQDGELVVTVLKRFKTGKVYVMNTAGKTVGTYDFDRK